jgi:hypothetical protein
MALIIFLTFAGILTLIGTGIVAIIGFIIGWKFSELFIPPRDHWTKSVVTMIGIKFGIALGGAYFAVVGIAALLSSVFG